MKQPCPFFMRGFCKDENGCKYSHDITANHMTVETRSYFNDTIRATLVSYPSSNSPSVNSENNVEAIKLLII